MKNTNTYSVFMGCMFTFFCCSISAQNSRNQSMKSSPTFETTKMHENYQKLISLGYKDAEIYEDLGNANFLSENYETALFWYRRLKDMSADGELSRGYQQRYDYALAKSKGVVSSTTSTTKDWVAAVKDDYTVKDNYEATDRKHRFKELNLHPNNEATAFTGHDDYKALLKTVEFLKDENLADENGYKAPIALTSDGKTAYFTKSVYEKPMYGLFSKKELKHKIFKADKVAGEWKNIQEVAVCPKNYSSLHPTISKDGKRLFFASDMPGTFGKYDIYVSTIKKDGSFGVAKNLGEKVNTAKNDLYPNIMDNDLLFFASEGRKGYGGMDVYMAQVGKRKVGLAVNLGNPINSGKDDFSIQFAMGEGMGYVMSNRGNSKNVRQVAFSYSEKKKAATETTREFAFMETLNSDSKINYSSSVFEDE